MPNAPKDTRPTLGFSLDDVFEHDLHVMKALRGLLDIAETAMPDTYYATDSRVRRAKRLMNKIRRRWGGYGEKAIWNIKP